MEVGLFFFGVLLVFFSLYRLASRKLATPQVRVRMLLRTYHGYERRGLPERDSLYRVLTGRRGWRNLPPAFIADIVARLRSKENVFRFVALAEEHRYNRKHLPAIATKPDRESAMCEVALWLCDFGNSLQKENRFKEAEFVQQLALGLQPDRCFTQLSLATTFYNLERYDEAAPLLENGLAQLVESINETGSRSDTLALLDGIDSDAARNELRERYENMRATCLKFTRKRPD